jgi:ABC-type glycerol-3-phosphate transport system substrate-binding protein
MSLLKQRVSRRAFTGGVAAGAAALAFAGRNINVLAADQVTVDLNIYQLNDNWHATLKKVLDGFMAANPTIKVNLNIQPAEQYWDKLQTQFAGGQAPDISLINADWIVPAASRGMFVDLKPYFDKNPDLLSDLWYPMEQDWGYNGGIYGGLLYAGGQMLYVNKTLLAAAGLDMPTADWTWDDLHTMAVTLTDESKQQYGVHISPINPPYWSSSFIHGAGGTVLNEAMDQATLTTPEAQAGLQYIVDMIQTDKIMPIPSTQSGEINPFMAGKAGFYFGGSWDESAIRTSGFDWDWARMPINAKTGIRKVQLGSNAWGILSTTKHQDESWEVVKYLGGPEGAKGMMSLGLPGFKSIIDSPEFKEIHKPQDISIPLADFQENPHNYYTTPDAAEWWNAMDQIFPPMWTGEDTVEGTTQKANDAINAIFAKRS